MPKAFSTSHYYRGEQHGPCIWCVCGKGYKSRSYLLNTWLLSRHIKAENA